MSSNDTEKPDKVQEPELIWSDSEPEDPNWDNSVERTARPRPVLRRAILVIALLILLAGMIMRTLNF